MRGHDEEEGEEGEEEARECGRDWEEQTPSRLCTAIEPFIYGIREDEDGEEEMGEDEDEEEDVEEVEEEERVEVGLDGYSS